MRGWQKTVPWASMARFVVPLIVMVCCLWALSGILDRSLLGRLPETLAALPGWLILGAGLYAALSLWAVARYDSLAHRHFDTGIPIARTRTTGFAAIAIGQTIGFGLLTGAAVRWRMLPELGLAGALKLSAFVSVTFILVFTFLTALICLVLPAPNGVKISAAIIVALTPLAALFLSFAPACAPLRHRITLPSLRNAVALLGWSAVDVLAAAFALFLLLPTGSVEFATFLPVFMLALGAAMLSGAPGGVGPFELTLVALLPSVASLDLVTAIIAFRALYYAVPAVLGVAAVLLSKRPEHIPHRSTPPLARMGAAELGILDQNGGALITKNNSTFALWRTTQTATLLFDPVEGTTADALEGLKLQATALGRIPVLYKCGGRTAAAARDIGWHVARIATSCQITPSTYDIDGPAHRSLRRKLRQAEKSCVQVTRALSLPLWDMAEIDGAWQDQIGRARGGTMGRFCPDYLARQEIFLAHHHGRLIAYASFHTRPKSRCLDLMRHLPQVPSGTMQMIVHTALMHAKSEDLDSVSLAALPDFQKWALPFGVRAKWFDNPGLAQFKRSFAPHETPLYAAAPTRVGLAVGLADIAAEVHAPPALASANKPHNQDDDYELDLDLRSWEAVPLHLNASR